MAAITLNNQMNIDALMIPGIFIDNYLPAAGGTDVKVYLYLLRAVSCRHDSLSIASLADTLELTEKEVMRSLSYWEKSGLLRLSFNSDHVLDGVTFEDISSKKPSEQISVSKSTPASVSAPMSASAPAPEPAKNNADANPKLTPEEHALIDNDIEFNNIYMNAWQQLFPSPFTYADTERISYWYLKFNKSADIMDYLIDYCASRKHPNTNYLNKVALAWHQKGLLTLAQIKEANSIDNNISYAVMKAFGLYNQQPAPAQYDYINKWIYDYGFSQEIIVTACNRTIEKLQKADFKYADGILRKWKAAKVKTEADIVGQDALHIQSKNHASEIPKSAQQFHNFEERDIDYDALILNHYNHN